MNQEMRYKFVHVRRTGEIHAGKAIFYVYNNKSNVGMAQIFWYRPWRMWCARFNEDTVWSEDCLADLRESIKVISEKEPKEAANAG